MTTSNKPKITARILHRYLGFFLAGIMTVYALSGTVLIFRDTDTFKFEKSISTVVKPGLTGEPLGQALHIRRLKVTKTEGDLQYFEGGSYNTATGEANYVEKTLPVLLDKMTHMHKATTDDSLFFLNIFFGASLLFFSLSSFWMFRPKSSIFKKGLYFTLGGIILTLVMVWV